MQVLPVKIPLTLVTVFFLGLASRDLNIHHTILSLDSHGKTVKLAVLTEAELVTNKSPLKIKQAE